MRSILLDTVGLVALWNAQDQWHEKAAKAMAAIKGEGADFCTTSCILLECGNAAARTPFRRDIVELRDQFIADGKLIEPSESDQSLAWLAHGRGEAGDASIVDHVSIVVMRRLGLTEVFSNDRHFKAAGFNTLF